MKAKIGIGVVDIHSVMIESPEKIRDEIMVASKILDDPSLLKSIQIAVCAQGSQR